MDVTSAQLARILARIERAWTQMGEVLPHYSVRTQSEFRPDRIATSVDRFWASGAIPLALQFAEVHAYDISASPLRAWNSFSTVRKCVSQLGATQFFNRSS